MVENKRNRKRAIMIGSIAAVAFGLLMSTIYIAFNQAQAGLGPTISDYAHNMKPISPEATLVKGGVAAVEVPSLIQLAESSEGTRPDLTDQYKTVTDAGKVIIGVYHANVAGNDILVATVKNAGTRDITVNSFLLQGFNRGPLENSEVEALYRPVISDPNDVVSATTTKYQTLSAGQSVTARTEGQFNIDGYAADTCYSYDPSDISTHYCVSTPITWIK